jgi:hypothetical protein
MSTIILDTLASCLTDAAGLLDRAAADCMSLRHQGNARRPLEITGTSIVAAGHAVCAALIAIDMLRIGQGTENAPSPGFAGSAKPARRAPRPKMGCKPPPSQKRS